MASEPPSKKSKPTNEAQENENNGVKLMIQDIRVCQKELEKLNDKASEEILQIEQKYNKIRKPFFLQRNALFKKIPKFWATVLSNHGFIGSIIQEEELECFKYMNDCVAEEFDNIKHGYMISFYFDENPYFENDVLTKTMHCASTANAKSESTPIKWKPGHNLLEKYSEKITKQSKKRRQPPATFFSWFITNSGPSGDEVAETIKEDVWPSALQYFLEPSYGDHSGPYEEEDDEGLSDEEDSEMEENMMKGAKRDRIAEAELAGLLQDDDSQSYNDSNVEDIESDSQEARELQSGEEENDEDENV